MKIRSFAVLLMTLTCADSEGAVAATSHPPVRDAASDCNVVWETPSTNSLGSMPLGNGDVGVNVWVEGNGDLLFYVSKVDAFDAGHSLPKLGRVRLRLDPPMPVEPFRQTLVLYDGAVTIRGGDVNLRVWVDANHPVNNHKQARRMKAVAINGSPRKGGNTEVLLRKVLEPLTAAGWETGFIQLGGMPIQGCRACYQCFKAKNARCGQKKDMFNECMRQMVKADAIILGSPTYFTDVSAEMKAPLDRAGLVALANGGLFRRKIGAAVIAVRRGGGTHTFDTINHMFLMSGAIIPGSTYWNLGFGLDKGEVQRDEEGLRNMRDLGETIAWLGKAIRQCADSPPRLVQAEPTP